MKSHFAGRDFVNGEDSGKILWTNTYCEVSLRRRRETSRTGRERKRKEE